MLTLKVINKNNWTTNKMITFISHTHSSFKHLCNTSRNKQHNQTMAL